MIVDVLGQELKIGDIVMAIQSGAANGYYGTLYPGIITRIAKRKVEVTFKEGSPGPQKRNMYGDGLVRVYVEMVKDESISTYFQKIIFDKFYEES